MSRRQPLLLSLRINRGRLTNGFLIFNRGQHSNDLSKKVTLATLSLGFSNVCRKLTFPSTTSRDGFWYGPYIYSTWFQPIPSLSFVEPKRRLCFELSVEEIGWLNLFSRNLPRKQDLNNHNFRAKLSSADIILRKAHL